MKKLEITFKYDGQDYHRIALLSDDLTQIIDGDENQCTDIVNGVADELYIWSLYFDNIECDFLAYMDGDEEICTLTPYEVLVWEDISGTECPIFKIKVTSTNHYSANVCHYASNCFHYFDDETKVFAWISQQIGEQVSSYDDCKKWNKSQERIGHKNGFIEIYKISDIKAYYKTRKAYASTVRKANDLLDKAQRVKKSGKRNTVFCQFTHTYEQAGDIAANNPEVWQGEI